MSDDEVQGDRMTPQEMTTTTTHDVMTCPACGQTISADVHVTAQVAGMTLNEGGGKVDMRMSATISRFHLTHHCTGRVVDATPSEETA